METKKAYDLHSEHSEWLSKLAFYADELKIMRKQLEELIIKYSGVDVLGTAEQFQNQLLIQKNELDELEHSIKDHEIYVENRISESKVADERKLNDHTKERDRMEQFEKLFNDMRKNFNSFLVKVT